jgi:WD40 repeat protein/serine/threonine protein kinase
MNSPLVFDEMLLARLPLPLAQLYRRAFNAKSSRDRHDAAYYLGEAALKLLGAVAVAAYAERPHTDPALAERLQNLARPSLGHWWQLVRLLTPVLAEAGDAGFASVRDLLFGRARDDLPRAAGLDAALVEVLQGKSAARSTVRLADLFEHLVSYRNREFGHGAAGARPAGHYERLGRALLLGMADVLGRLDVLAGHRLLYVAEVRRRGDGAWIVERADLGREKYQRVESLVLPADAADQLPRPERVYLQRPAAESADAAGGQRLLHPLLVYDAEADEVLFLNARRGKERVEYLSYTSGRVVERADLAGEQRELLRRVLDMPAAEVAVEAWAARSAAEEPASEEAVSGRRHLGEFELVSKLGQGGMGIVYRARQPSLGREVALKCLFRTGDPKAEARFAREIHALGRVDHPHLVKIYASGAEGEHWFYAMELIEGATLAAVCERVLAGGSSVRELDLPTWRETVSSVSEVARRQEQPVSDEPPAAPPESPESGLKGKAAADGSRPAPRAGKTYVRQVVELVRQVSEAAEALHGRGIIHRDIKPGNIMVGPDGSTAVLMDLGLAQVADEVEGRLTKTRQFVGTLRYASPEQVLAAGRLDGRSDVYSLGATLWELLTLRPLYGATEQTPTPELMQRIQVEEPARVRKHNPAVPRDLEAVVERCLQKDPRRRYATARELGEDLQRFLESRPVKARRVSGLERGLKWARRRPVAAVLLAVSGLAIGAVIAILAVTNVLITQEQQQTAKALGERNRALEEVTHEKHQTQLALERERQAAYFHRITLADGEWQAGHVARADQILDECHSELRQWEWHYLKRLCHTETLTLPRHTGPVRSVAFSPDGKRVATGSGSHHFRGEIKIWDAHTGQELLTLGGHARGVSSVAFSPDGKHLASGSDDATVRVWDATTGTELLTLRGHVEGITNVGFGRQWLVSASYDGGVIVWDTNGQKRHTLLGHRGQVLQGALSADGQRLVSVDGYQDVKIWDVGRGTELLSLRGWPSAAFSPDGKRLAVGFHPASTEQTADVKLLDANNGKELLTFRGMTDDVRSMAFSPDGQWLAAASNNVIKIWDMKKAQELLRPRGAGAAATAPPPVLRELLTLRGAGACLAFSPDGKHLAAAAIGTDDQPAGEAKIWDMRTCQGMLTVETGFRCATVFSSDGKRLALTGERSAVYDLTTGKSFTLCRRPFEESSSARRQSPLHDREVTSVVFSADGSRLTSESEGTVKFWDTTTGQQLRTIPSRAGRPTACSSEGTRVAETGPGSVKIWDVSTAGKLVTVPLPAQTQITLLTFSPDGRRLIAGTTPGNEVLVWDAATGKELLTLKGHAERVHSVVFSPDGQRLVSLSRDQTTRVWDMPAGRELLVVPQGTSVTFSPDSKRLASVSKDRTARVWDVPTGRELLVVPQIWSVTFSPNGERLASVSNDKTARIWDVLAGRELLAVQQVNSVVFSPDNQRLAFVSEDKIVRIWHLLTSRELLVLRGHTDRVNGVTFSPDGERLVSASADKTVRIWDTTSGRNILTIRRSAFGVYGVTFSPDGNRLTARAFSTATIWDASSVPGRPPPADWRERAQAVEESHPDERKRSSNYLKMIGLAMHNYHDANGKLPPAVGYGPDGKTPHSWRVLLLPYVEHQALYQQYDFREPWDGPNNRKLLAKMPAIYRHPLDAADSTHASMFAITGSSTVFSGKGGASLQEIRDKSHTILVVEGKRAIPWTKPEDIPYEPGKVFPEMGGYYPDGFYVASADGSVCFLSCPQPDEHILGRMFTKTGMLPPLRPGVR